VRASRRALAALLALLWVSPVLAPPLALAAQKRPSSVKAKVQTTKTTPAARRSSKPAVARAKPTPPPSKPDRALYLAAKSTETRLRGSARLKAKAAEWEKVASAYRTVVGRYPRSSYCDDALLNAGNLQREMARLFKNRRYSDQAVESYGLIVSEYPGSRLGEPALYATYQILTERKQTTAAKQAAEKYLAAYPDGAQARALGLALKTSKAERTAAAAATAGAKPLPRGGAQFERASTKSSGEVQIFGVRFWSGEASTRVVIDLDRKVEIKQDRLQSPPRLFVDLIGTRMHPNLIGKSFPVGDGFLKQIRIGVNRENVVRVVIDFDEASSHNVFFLADPERLVIDVKGAGPRDVRVASASPAPGAIPTPTSIPPETMEHVEVTQPLPVVPEPSPFVGIREPSPVAP